MATTTITIEEILKNGKILAKWSRWTGTGYKSAQYQYENQFFQIDFNCHSNGNFFDSLKEIEDPRPAKKAFAQKCAKAAKEWGIPFKAVLAVGPEYADDIKCIETEIEFCFDTELAEDYRFSAARELILDFISCERDGWQHSGDMAWSLACCGIGKRKEALIRLLPSLEEKISAMGQENSRRIASYVLDVLRTSETVIKMQEMTSVVKDRSVKLIPTSVDEDGAAVWSF